LGIQSHGKAIAVVGDNVSNVSTYGYKKSRAEFSDIVADGKGGEGSVPVTNPGDGVWISSVRQIHTGGIIEDTGRNLDLAIQGNGLFAVGIAESPAYTRAGVFALDETGNLVDSAGKSVLGYAPGVAVGTLPLIPISTQVIDLGAIASTESMLSGALDSRLPLTNLPNNPQNISDVTKLASFTYAMSSFDSQGAPHDMTVAFFKTGPNQWTAQAYVRGNEVGGSADTIQQVGPNVELAFTETGQLPEGTAAQMAINIPYGGGVAPGSITLDLSGFIQVATASAIFDVKDNGQAASQVQGVDIDEEGSVNAIFGSGQRRSLGTIALVDFINKDGLAREGAYDYFATDKAGTATVGAPSQGAFGSLRSGALERSTVDISEEFIDLVVFQRGYQANSQTFSTTSELLQQTIQLLG
jgi:flagellar hook protein FlgE